MKKEKQLPKRTTYAASSFWWDDDMYTRSESSTTNAIQLAAYRKAISNFVRIVTGQDIPVRFASKGDSFTDGKCITISSSLTEKKFDPAVGLALHEASHIKLTNFDVLKQLDDFINRHDDIILKYCEKYGVDRWDSVRKIGFHLKDLLNIIEDRRIDNFIYTTSPGYRGYYQALYKQYFDSKIIDRGLQSSEYRTEDWDSYMFRIINITNRHRDLNALSKLQKVWDVMNLPNIKRLQTTQQALDVAWEIFQIIEDAISPPPANDNSESSQSDTEQHKATDDSASIRINGEIEDPQMSEDDEAANEQVSDTQNNIQQLSDRQRHQLEEQIRDQREFLNGSIKKKQISSKVQRHIDTLEASDIDYNDVTYESRQGIQKAEVVVIKRLTMQLIETIDCTMWTRYDSSVLKMKEHVNAGLIFGTMLGKKLQIRNDERQTKFNRCRSGQIDKRMIPAAGFGAEHIFQRLETFEFKKGTIHISIDNSGSMGSGRLDKAITTAVAIAKAASMTSNLNCVISFRSSGNFLSKRDCPIMMIAYDSRRDSIAMLQRIMPYVTTSGGTPEGLCFDACMKSILHDAAGNDAYFINMSDGEPYYHTYCGTYAEAHTRAQVKKMEAANIKVISYFISNSSIYGSSSKAFKNMYGENASFINVSQMREVASSLNRKLIQPTK